LQGLDFLCLSLRNLKKYRAERSPIFKSAKSGISVPGQLPGRPGPRASRLGARAGRRLRARVVVIRNHQNPTFRKRAAAYGISLISHKFEAFVDFFKFSKCNLYLENFSKIFKTLGNPLK